MRFLCPACHRGLYVPRRLMKLDGEPVRCNWCGALATVGELLIPED